MKIAVCGLLLGAAALVASTGVSQAQPLFGLFMPQCKEGYKYDSAKNVCKVDKKKKVKKAKKKK